LLLVTVRANVVLGRMLGMLDGLNVVAMSEMCMMSGLFVVVGFVMAGGFLVMARSVLVMFSCLLVMMSCFLGHKFLQTT
jgi:hypothetical protein